MEFKYFVLFDKDTSIPISIAPSPFFEITNTQCTVQITQSEAFPFFEKKRLLPNYFVMIEDGFGKFFPKGQTKEVKKVSGENYVRDIGYAYLFFDRLFIEFTQVGDTLFLKANMPPEAQYYFDSEIAQDNVNATIYITRYKEPNALLASYPIDMLQLNAGLTITLPTSNIVSVWGGKG